MTASSTFLNSEPPHRCTACGSALTGRWERMTPGLSRTLIKFYTAICAKRKNEVHLNECDLTKSEYTNFQKLRYFALATRAENPGHWLITWKGRDFIRGLGRVHARVFVFQNRIVKRDETTVSIADVLKTEIYWLKKDDFLDGRQIYALDQETLF